MLSSLGSDKGQTLNTAGQRTHYEGIPPTRILEQSPTDTTNSMERDTYTSCAFLYLGAVSKTPEVEERNGVVKHSPLATSKVPAETPVVDERNGDPTSAPASMDKMTASVAQRRKVDLSDRDRKKMVPSRRLGKPTRHPLAALKDPDGNAPRRSGCIFDGTMVDISFLKDRLESQKACALCGVAPSLYKIRKILSQMRRGTVQKQVSTLPRNLNEEVEFPLQTTHRSNTSQTSGIEFRISKPKILTTNRTRPLKEALLGLNRTDVNLMDSFRISKEAKSGDTKGVLINHKPKELYKEELQNLEKLLPFPAEVALRITSTEVDLFTRVKPFSYFKEATTTFSDSKENDGDRGINILIQRFYEVSCWVTNLLITQPNHVRRKATLVNLVRLAQCCWDTGNFNSAVEILAGLKSEKLKPFWLSMKDEDLSQYYRLCSIALSTEDSTEYWSCLSRISSLPESNVVPFFGSFLREFQSVLTETPSIIILDTQKKNKIKSLSVYRGQDNFMSRIGPGGLIDDDKLSKILSLLNTIESYQQLNMLHSNGGHSGTSMTTKFVDALDMHLPLETNERNEHSVHVIPDIVTATNVKDILSLRSGCTAIYCPSDSKNKVLCWMKLESDNVTLSWRKCDMNMPVGYSAFGQNAQDILHKRYSSTTFCMDDVDAGYLDLRQVRSIVLNKCPIDLKQIPSVKQSLTVFQKEGCELNSIQFDVGYTATEFRQFEFVLPPLVTKMWFPCFHCLVGYAKYLRQYQVDKRVQWLQEQYLRLYHIRTIGRPPTATEAIKLFGGRDWTTSSVNIGSLIEVSTLSRKQRMKMKASTVSSSRDRHKRPSLFQLQTQFSLHDSDETVSDSATCKSPPFCNGSHKLTATSPTSKTFDQCHQPLKKIKSQEVISAKMDPTNLVDEKRRHSMWSHVQIATSGTKSDTLNFLDFKSLFQSFYTLLRKDVKDLFDMVAVESPKQYHMSPVNDAHAIASGLFGWTQDIPPDAKQHKLFDSLSIASIVENRVDTGKQKLLGMKEFKYFLKEYQGEKLRREQVMHLILKHERDPELRKLCQMSFEGFCRYLLEETNFAFTPENIAQDSTDMEHPLTHYYIKSSHNTYLTGHQLKGESSVQMYTQVLLTGCRCVELDCWDGDDGYPIIYHGHTLTTKIPFKDVVEAINENAFTASPYPVILSLENHCSVSQQKKMAAILIDTLGGKLVKEFLFEDDFRENPCLPSPSQLRYRILIKNKKLRSHGTPDKAYQKQTLTYVPTDESLQDELEEEYEDEDEMEDYDFEDSDGKTTSSLKSPLDSDSSSSSKRMSVPSLNDEQLLLQSSRPETIPRRTHTRAKSMDYLSFYSDPTSTPEIDKSQLRFFDAGSTDSLLTTADDSSSELDEDLVKNATPIYHRPLVSRVSEPVRPVLQRQKIVYHHAKRWVLDDKQMVCTSPSPPKFDGGYFRTPTKHEAQEAKLQEARRSLLLIDETYNDIPEMVVANVEEVVVSDVPDVINVVPMVTECNSNKSCADRRAKVFGRAKKSKQASASREICAIMENAHANVLGTNSGSECEASFSDRTRKNSIKFRPRSAPTYADWQNDVRDQDSSTNTSTPRKRKKVNIAPELSEIVIYTQAIKFKGLMSGLNTTLKQKKAANKRAATGPCPQTPDSAEFQPSMDMIFTQVERAKMPSCYQMSSLNENKAKQECRKHPGHVIKHTETHLMRMYPAATRIDSANFSPILYWACGIQMSALNYQTDDTPMHVNAAMFEQMGLSGYVLKPRVMWDPAHPRYDRHNPLDKQSEGCQSVTLKIRVISGQYVCPKNLLGSPQVEVDVISIPADCAKHKTRAILRNAVNPIWNEKHSFRVTCQELTFVRFAVTDTNSGTITGQRVIPLKQFKLGYRHVRLRTPKNQPLEISTLFIFTRIEEDVSMHKNLSFFSLSTETEEVNEDQEQSEQTASGSGHKDQFLVCVYDVSSDQAYCIVKAAKSSTAQDVITRALRKARLKESPQSYVLVEEREVRTICDGKSRHKMTSTRVLEDDENIYEIQRSWENITAKFVMKPRSPSKQAGQKIKGSSKKFALSKLSLIDREKKKKEECCHPYLSLPTDSPGVISSPDVGPEERNNNQTSKDVSRVYTSKSQQKNGSKFYSRGKQK